MALIKRRPEITLRASQRILAGTKFEAIVELDVAEELECTAVHLEQRGVQRRTTQGEQYAQSGSLYRMVARSPVAGGRLGPGRQSFRFALQMPSGSPPTYRGTLMQISHLVAVRVDIPWWPDARASFELHVAQPRDETLARLDGGVFGSREDGGAGGSPYLEVSMAERTLVAGDQFRLAAAVFNTDRHAYRAIDVRLVAQEEYSSTTSGRPVASWRVPIDEAVDGRAIPIALRLPGKLVPAFRFGSFKLAWRLEVSADLRWGDPTVRVPVHLSLEPGGESDALAEVGDVRLARLWNSVAAELNFDAGPGSMVGRVGGVDVRLERSGAVGVDATLEFSALGLGIGRAGWRERVVARDPEHVEPLRARLADVVEAAGLVHLDDRGARAHSDNAGRNPDPLREYAAAVIALAEALDGIDAGLPPPAALADQLEAWTSLAERIDGRLVEASMQIRGRRGETAFFVAPRWDGSEAVAVAIGVIPSPPMEGRHHLTWRAADDDAPRTTLELDDAWGGALGLEIDGASVRVLVPVDDVAGGASVVSRLEVLLGLCRARGSGGVYR